MLQSFALRRGGAPLPFAFTSTLLTVGALTLALAASLSGTAHAQETPTTQTPTTPAPVEQAAPAPQAASTTPASEDEPKKKRFVFGPEVGVYFPSSSKTQRAFGSSWFTYGIGFGAIQETRSGGRVQVDFSYLSHSKGGSRIDIAPIGVSYRYGLGHGARTETGPYIGVSGDLFLTQIREDDAHIVSRIRGTGGGTAFIGTTFGQRANVQARYYELGSIRGYNFSGMNLSAGYRF